MPVIGLDEAMSRPLTFAQVKVDPPPSETARRGNATEKCPRNHGLLGKFGLLDVARVNNGELQ